MVMARVPNRQRQRVNLTIDPKVWALCREKGEKYGLNWSQIAEEAFLGILLQLQEVEKIVESDSSGLETSIVKSKLKNYINRACSELNEELNQELEDQMSD